MVLRELLTHGLTGKVREIGPHPTAFDDSDQVLELGQRQCGRDSTGLDLCESRALRHPGGTVVRSISLKYAGTNGSMQGLVRMGENRFINVAVLREQHDELEKLADGRPLWRAIQQLFQDRNELIELKATPK